MTDRICDETLFIINGTTLEVHCSERGKYLERPPGKELASVKRPQNRYQGIGDTIVQLSYIQASGVIATLALHLV